MIAVFRVVDKVVAFALQLLGKGVEESVCREFARSICRVHVALRYV